MRVNGELKDLATTVTRPTPSSRSRSTSPDGLNILRHSAAHVLAQAVQTINPEAKLGIGPPDHRRLLLRLRRRRARSPPRTSRRSRRRWTASSAQGQRFVRRVVTDEEARAELADEPYKLELIGLKGRATGDGSERRRRVGRGRRRRAHDLRQRRPRRRDRLEGPLPRPAPAEHPHDRQRLGSSRASPPPTGAGREKNPQLQRIYGTAWPTKDELRAYQQRLEEAAKRDHRKLGDELDLFSFPEEIGSGLSVWHPQGRHHPQRDGAARAVAATSRRGYTYVYTPHITKEDLFVTSRTTSSPYKEGMFPPIAHGRGARRGRRDHQAGRQDYYLKPMNCPMHILIYRERAPQLPRPADAARRVRHRLPQRAVAARCTGLTRVRGFTQDDAHLFVTPEQLEDEVDRACSSSSSRLLRDFGLDDFELELSMRDDEKDKWIGDDEFWEDATDALRDVALASGLEARPRCRARPRSTARRSTCKATRRDRPHLAAVDRAARLQPARALRARVHRPRRPQEAAGHDPPRAVRLDRAVLRDPARALRRARSRSGCRPVQVVGIPVAEEYADYLGEVIDAAAGATACAPSSTTATTACRRRSATHTHAQGAVPADRGRAGPRRPAPVSFRFRDGTQENGVPDRRGRRAASARRSTPHALVEHGGGPRRDADLIDGERVRRAADDARRRSPGVPDGFQRLWTPHRIAYIEPGPQPPRRRVPVLRRARR